MLAGTNCMLEPCELCGEVVSWFAKESYQHTALVGLDCFYPQLFAYSGGGVDRQLYKVSSGAETVGYVMTASDFKFREFVIMHMCITASQQGGGIGSAIVKYFQAHTLAHTADFDRLWLDCTADKVAFFQRRGLSRTDKPPPTGGCLGLEWRPSV